MPKQRKLFGKSKHEATEATTGTQQPETPKNYWICPKCGTQNSVSSLSCKDCGAYK